jgi:NADP-dependent 3-hydroxy acid dehydrogenase YdfG
VTDEAFDKIFHTNSKSVAFALKHFLPAIEKSGGNGSVVVNSSVASRTVCTEAMGFVLYAASKAANNMMTQYAVSTQHTRLIFMYTHRMRECLSSVWKCSAVSFTLVVTLRVRGCSL